MDGTIRNQHIAKSALDMAAYDLLGKSAGLPVHALLGGKLRDSMEVMWSVGGTTPEESASEVLACREAGYKGCMIKIGSVDWENDAERTIAVRDTVGPGFPLIVDANQGWDADTAIRYWKRIRNCGILFYEQPVQSWDVDGMAKVRRAIDIPLSADESCATPQDAVRLINAGAADIFSIKVSKNGGILPAKRICELASLHGVRVFFNSMIEEGVTQAASLCVGATCLNIVMGIGHAFFSPRRLDGDICSYEKQIKRGTVEVSGEPGLGIAMDHTQMEKYTVEAETV
jgi:muconate cycloisomerase